ncbi:Hypp3594 [Branchiostoma lanceolatum]|uniref:Hypp3594 protein n=1 Tax=Branchiostoma lanceolatum TaxID=7740 RepID=A0A8K0A2H4_BRALA|nr:Hypp3594 [Branchiostoma lanceolatum]
MHRKRFVRLGLVQMGLSLVGSCMGLGAVSVGVHQMLGGFYRVFFVLTVASFLLLNHFTYLGSTTSSNLSLDKEIDKRIGKSATTLARLTTRVWENPKLSVKTKMAVYNACVLSTLLYGSETWQRRLRWLGHVRRMEDGRIPKDLLYGELISGKRRTWRPQLRFKDVCKRDLKALDIDTEHWEDLASDRSRWRCTLSSQLKSGEARLMHSAEGQLLYCTAFLASNMNKQTAAARRKAVKLVTHPLRSRAGNTRVAPGRYVMSDWNLYTHFYRHS